MAEGASVSVAPVAAAAGGAVATLPRIGSIATTMPPAGAALISALPLCARATAAFLASPVVTSTAATE
eukprot:2148743-Prymnesium_polylepis.1